MTVTAQTTTARPGARLRLAGVGRRFGDVHALDDVSLELAPGSFTALLGPSGCGKSTLLNLIAGLDRSGTGSIVVDADPLDGVPAERRRVGLVLQRPLLFPHLSVAANVAFGLRMARVPRRTARTKALEMLEKVQLTGLADRRAGDLSGGQEQRVALARALVLAPRLLLLDEPFSQLDASLRAGMRRLVRELVEESKVTTLFVTHDQAEAVDIADDIVLMLGGRLSGQGAPEMFYRRPPSLAAARFFGAANELAGLVTAGRFSSADGAVSLPTDAADGAAVLVIRPESFTLHPAGAAETASAAVCLAGTAVGARFAGTHLGVQVILESGARVSVQVPLGTPVDLGSAVAVTARAEQCTVFPVTSALP